MFPQRFLFFSFFCEALFEFLDRHTEVSVSTFFAKNGKLKNQLDLRSVMARNKVLKPRMQRFYTWKYTLPMFLVRFRLWDSLYHRLSDRYFLTCVWNAL